MLFGIIAADGLGAKAVLTLFAADDRLICFAGSAPIVAPLALAFARSKAMGGSGAAALT